jgi:hypothetical protein
MREARYAEGFAEDVYGYHIKSQSKSLAMLPDVGILVTDNISGGCL